MTGHRKPLTADEFELLVSQVVIPNHWHGAKPLTERQMREVGNNSYWEHVLAEVSQVTRDNYLEHIRTWWMIRDANNADRLTRCPEDNRYCKPGLDGALCDLHQEIADEEAAA
jgi:hypothetical protein